MKTQCPHCKAKFNAPNEYKGKKVKCPKCKEQFEVAPHIDVQEETAQETRSDDSDFSTRVLIAVISGALCLAVGLGSGVLLTIPNRGKTKAKIATLETKLNEIQTATQEKVQAAESETVRFRDELKRISSELEQTKKALQASAQKREGPDTKANSLPVEKDRIVKPNYTVLSENIHDVPIKTQVELNILVSGEISDTGLRSLLKELYSSTKAKRGFKYHNPPTNIYIYAFISKERADSGMGQWIAMLQESPGDEGPSISINERQMAHLGSEPEKKFGLSEAKRKQIWTEIVQAEDRATKEAEQRYPDLSPLKPGYSQSAARRRFEQQIEFGRTMTNKYKIELAEKHSLTLEQLKEIALEGLTKDWAMPKLYP